MLGFFSTAASESAAPSNFGMLDQLAAMQWVQTNAAAFGGDAARVLIFGCSAGGASVAGHLVNSAADGLYSAAAMESPGGHQGWMQDTKRSDDDWMSASLNLANSGALAHALNCTGRSDVACLQALDLGTLYHASLPSRFAPALVGEMFPLGLIHAGKWSKVPAIAGGQSCESCGNAASRLGPPSSSVTTQQLSDALVAEGFTGELISVPLHHFTRIPSLTKHIYFI